MRARHPAHTYSGHIHPRDRYTWFTRPGLGDTLVDSAVGGRPWSVDRIGLVVGGVVGRVVGRAVNWVFERATRTFALRPAQDFGRVDDCVCVTLFGQEPLAVGCERLVIGVTRDDRIEPGRAIVLLGSQDATEPLRLFLSGTERSGGSQ